MSRKARRFQIEREVGSVHVDQLHFEGGLQGSHCVASDGMRAAREQHRVVRKTQCVVAVVRHSSADPEAKAEWSFSVFNRRLQQMCRRQRKMPPLCS